MERKLTCIICPRGCRLTVALDGKEAGAVILPPYRVRIEGETNSYHFTLSIILSIEADVLYIIASV